MVIEPVKRPVQVLVDISDMVFLDALVVMKMHLKKLQVLVGIFQHSVADALVVCMSVSLLLCWLTVNIKNEVVLVAELEKLLFQFVVGDVDVHIGIGMVFVVD